MITRFFLIGFVFLGLVSCSTEEHNPCTQSQREYDALKESLSDHVHEWVRLSHYELKYPSLDEWVRDDPDRRYERLKEMQEENAECLQGM